MAGGPRGQRGGGGCCIRPTGMAEDLNQDDGAAHGDEGGFQEI